jgi:CHAT domain-containing protein
VQRFGELAEIGVDQAIVSLYDVHDPASFALMPALVEQLAGITPAGR